MSLQNAKPGDAAAAAHEGRDKSTDVGRAPIGADRVIRLSTAQLFHDANEIHIEHGQALYRLRITSLGKLILTK